MTFVIHSSVAPKPTAGPAHRAGSQFLKSRRSALTREGPSRGNLLYTQALQLARLQDQEDAARTAFEQCCKAEPDNTKVLQFAQSLGLAISAAGIRLTSLCCGRHGFRGLSLRKESRSITKIDFRRADKCSNKG